ncbi:MAG TPA: flagellar hook protein FlgE [Candidatus Acidoferrales bacterium]|jgi:flagellar hook protein FlgE|nr:flagellar hook protein FlgE [Candidatus Acidoferrales bacterium]
MPSFSTALSGLDAESQALSVISNNLANLNTVAFKSQSPEFQDLFYQQIGSSGSGDPIQIGVGTTVGSISANFTQGSIESTGVPTDVAIQGNGFLVEDNNGLQEYTRSGDLSVGATGQLMTSDGGNVLGYTAVNGVISPSQTLGPLSVASGQISPPNPTSNVAIDMNLDSAGGVGSTFSTPATVTDAQGNSHVLTYNFTNTAANTWTYQISIPAADVGATGAPVTVGTGTLKFDGSGVLQTPATDVTGIKITGLADGASDLTFNWNLYDASNNPLVTQVATPSAASSTTQDGYSSGTLTSFNIQSDGTIQGIFSNGQTLALGQIALASFPNVQGLVRNGSNNYLASLASGSANIGAPATGGRGTIAGGSLEESNVDIATQFASLILAERGYQANAKTVTTFDEVTQTAINMQAGA